MVRVNSQLKDQLDSALCQLENLNAELGREAEDRNRMKLEMDDKEKEWIEEKKVSM